MGRMSNSERYVQQEDGSYIRSPVPPALAQTEADAAEATDAAEELAAELGVDLASIEGTGKDGRVTVADVRAAAE